MAIVEWTITPVMQKHMERNGYSRFDVLGFLEGMLSDSNPAGAVSQLDAGYQHGGGWNAMKGFSLVIPGFDPIAEYELTYPGDPPMICIARCKLRDEKILLFDGSWVCVVQPDGKFEVARMD